MPSKRDIEQALEKLDWIAELSKNKCPDGVPGDPEKTRRLLNRIVLDVRAARKLLHASDKSNKSDTSENSHKRPGLIPKHGGFRNLRSFQVAELLYDGTVIFCNRFISKRSRTHDQMVQAARSGRQNIAEGSLASATSKKTELKLTNVAKASLGELLLDYEDYLRQHRLRQWRKNDPEAMAVRTRYSELPREWFQASDKSDKSDPSDLPPHTEPLDPYGIGTASPETAANTLLCLANQAIYLLKRQIEKMERHFVEEGGFTEKLYRTRKRRRDGR